MLHFTFEVSADHGETVRPDIHEMSAEALEYGVAHAEPFDIATLDEDADPWVYGTAPQPGIPDTRDGYVLRWEDGSFIALVIHERLINLTRARWPAGFVSDEHLTITQEGLTDALARVILAAA